MVALRGEPNLSARGRLTEVSYTLVMALPARADQADVFATARVKAIPVVDHPRENELGWLREHAKEYAGQWVALDGAKLLGAATRLQDLLAQIAAPDRARKPLFHRVDAD